MDIVRNPKPIAASPRPDHAVIAIGDIHGHMDLFEQLLATARKIIPDQAAQTDIVLLGDMIDRGPQSQRVIDWLGKDHGIGNPVGLLGNHEQLLLALLEASKDRYENHYDLWMSNGGKQTLDSLDGTIPEPRRTSIKAHKQAIKKALGPERLKILQNLKSHYRNGDLLCVHAGIDPHLSLDENFMKDRLERDPTHWAWVRDPFLSHEEAYPDDVFIVHGHTILPGPHLKPHRIGLDTGGYRYGVLSGALFFNKTITVFQATRN